MPHQDLSPSVSLNSRYLKQALQWLLVGMDWKTIAFRHDCTWTPPLLVRAALLWAWSGEQTLQERFVTTHRLMAYLFPDHGPLAGSSQAFMKLLRHWTVPLVCLLTAALRKRVRQALPWQWESCGFVVYGVDGSRVELPRTKSHEAAYAPSLKRLKPRKPSCGKRSKRAAGTKAARVPQMWLTTLFHVGTGLPWDWRIGPADSSEREHALQMLKDLPEGSLMTADAGFVGYDFARQVLESGRHLLVRVGANVKLLRKLGFVRESSGTVYVWPDEAARRFSPPLVFRLIVAQGPRSPISLITSVLSPKTLNDRAVLDLYRKRWGVELFYRTLKQTFGRRKLRSLSSQNAAVELEWSLVGLWGMGLSAAVEIAKVQVPLSRISMAGVLQSFRRLMRDYRHPVVRGQTFCAMLRESVTDTYERKNKASRNFTRKKKEQPAGSPKIIDATFRQIEHARVLSSSTGVKGVGGHPLAAGGASMRNRGTQRTTALWDRR